MSKTVKGTLIDNHGRVVTLKNTSANTDTDSGNTIIADHYHSPRYETGTVIGFGQNGVDDLYIPDTFATKAYVDSKIPVSDGSGTTVDLSAYAKKTDLDNYALSTHNHDNVYAKQSDLNNITANTYNMHCWHKLKRETGELGGDEEWSSDTSNTYYIYFSTNFEDVYYRDIDYYKTKIQTSADNKSTFKIVDKDNKYYSSLSEFIEEIKSNIEDEETSVFISISNSVGAADTIYILDTKDNIQIFDDTHMQSGQSHSHEAFKITQGTTYINLNSTSSVGFVYTNSSSNTFNDAFYYRYVHIGVPSQFLPEMYLKSIGAIIS